MATSAIPASARKPRLLRKASVVLFLLVAVAAAAFYWRPTAFSAAFQRYTTWRIGLENHDVTLGNYRIHYLVGGEGKPLVLVHGWRPISCGSFSTARSCSSPTSPDGPWAAGSA